MMMSNAAIIEVSLKVFCAVASFITLTCQPKLSGQFAPLMGNGPTALRCLVCFQFDVAHCDRGSGKDACFATSSAANTIALGSLCSAVESLESFLKLQMT